jgi:H+-transporting ATPase
MVTGDAAPTALAVARAVGIGDRLCTVDPPAHDDGSRPTARLDACDVFAGVFPADKFRLVEALQDEGHIVGMTGDGVNDAAALRQAEVGVAVERAVDVAKSAAGVVLTTPGLAGILDVVDGGRRIYRRMLTYTLNKITKTFHIALFLSAGVLLTGIFVTTPALILLLLLANDVVTMSIATDHVAPSPRPSRWRVSAVAGTALSLAAGWLLLTMAVFIAGRDVLQYGAPQLQTLAFLTLVFTGQATIYLVRCDGWLWSTAPSRYLLAGTALDLVVASGLAIRGMLMARVDAGVVVVLLLVVAVASVLLDAVKVAVSRRHGVRPEGA